MGVTILFSLFAKVPRHVAIENRLDDADALDTEKSPLCLVACSKIDGRNVLYPLIQNLEA